MFCQSDGLVIEHRLQGAARRARQLRKAGRIEGQADQIGGGHRAVHVGAQHGVGRRIERQGRQARSAHRRLAVADEGAEQFGRGPGRDGIDHQAAERAGEHVARARKAEEGRAARVEAHRAAPLQAGREQFAARGHEVHRQAAGRIEIAAVDARDSAAPAHQFGDAQRRAAGSRDHVRRVAAGIETQQRQPAEHAQAHAVRQGVLLEGRRHVGAEAGGGVDDQPVRVVQGHHLALAAARVEPHRHAALVGGEGQGVAALQGLHAGAALACGKKRVRPPRSLRAL